MKVSPESYLYFAAIVVVLANVWAMIIEIIARKNRTRRIKMNKQQDIELELLCAKQAIFKLIGQSCRAVAFEDKDGLYVYDYCESAFEAAFNVLGIEEDCIELSEFCQMWEDNDRAIWAIKNPDVPFNGIIAEMHYKIFSDDYDNWVKMVTEEFTEDEDY